MDEKMRWLIFIPDSIRPLNTGIVPEKSERFEGLRYLTPDDARELAARLANLADYLDDKITAEQLETRNPLIMP